MTDDDFEKGRAVHYRNMTFCQECREGLSGVVESVADEEDKEPEDVGESTLREAIEIDPESISSAGSDQEGVEEVVETSPRRHSETKRERAHRGSSASPSPGNRRRTQERPGRTGGEESEEAIRRGGRRSGDDNKKLYVGIGLIVAVFLVIVLLLAYL